MLLLPLLGTAAKAIGLKVLPKAVGAIGKAVGKVLGGGGTASKVVRTVAGTALATAGVRQIAAPPPPPAPPLPFAPPRPPAGPVTRVIQRVLPGGKTGREFTPATEMTDKFGRPLLVFPDTRERLVAPPGYVIVRHPASGEPLAMLRGAAIRAGLFRPRPKPPVSAQDAEAIRRANAARKRVQKLGQKVGLRLAARPAPARRSRR